MYGRVRSSTSLPKWTRWPRTSSGKPWSPMSARGWCGSIWDTLLPERWAEMDLFERRNFLTGSDFGGLQEKGDGSAYQRVQHGDLVRVLRQGTGQPRRTDSNELTGILARLGWKRAESKVRIPLYGPQYVFVPKGCSQ